MEALIRKGKSEMGNFWKVLNFPKVEVKEQISRIFILIGENLPGFKNLEGLKEAAACFAASFAHVLVFEKMD